MKSINFSSFLLLFLILFSIQFNLYPQLIKHEHSKNVIANYNYYSDSNHVEYCDVIEIKFNQNVLNLPAGKSAASISDITNNYGQTLAALQQIKNKFNTEISFEKLFPDCIWGKITGTNRKTWKQVKLKELSQYFKLIFSNPVPIEEVLNYFKNINEIEYAKRPVCFSLMDTPNDPLFDNGSQWNLNVINSIQAWDITHGNSTIKVGINDDGMRKTHEDLSGKSIGGNNVLDDPAYGYHGTSVAGVVGASTNNSIGIASLGRDISLYNYGSATMSNSDLRTKLQQAVTAGMDIINMSWVIDEPVYVDCSCSGKGTLLLKIPTEDDATADVIYDGQQLGVIFVAAAGNRSENDCPTCCDPWTIPVTVYPAAYPDVIGVSATTNDYTVEQFKDNFNYGSFVDYSAPGANIEVLDGGSPSGYKYEDGTSFAAPLVVALIGLIESVNPNLQLADINTILQNSCDQVDISRHPYVNGRNDYLGYGRINAYKALKYTLTNYGGTLTQNLNIYSGETWAFQPGVTISIAPGVNINVNGTMSTQSTSLTNPVTFTSTGSTSPGSWGTITFGPGSSNSNLQYANIQYGTEIDVATSNITIQNCVITNSSMHGLNFISGNGNHANNNMINNSNSAHGIYVQSAANVTCIGNTIKKPTTNRTGVGIYFGGGGNGTVSQNDITGYSWGIGATWGSSPTSYSGQNGLRNNRVSNCGIGLNVYNNSYPTFGIQQSNDPYGYNSISGNNSNVNVYNQYSYYNSGINGYHNFWGYPLNTSLFYIGTGAYFNFDNYLQVDPWAGIPPPQIGRTPVILVNQSGNIQDSKIIDEADVSLGDSNIADSFFTGIDLMQNNKFNEAKDFFISYIKQHPDNQAAYTYLYNCANSNTTSEITNFFTSLPSKALEEQKLLLSYLYLRQGNIELAKNVNNSIIKDNPNTPLETRAKLNNFYIALYNYNDINTSSALLNEIKNQAILSTQMEISTAEDALYVRSSVISANTVSPIPKHTFIDEIEKPTSYSLSQNYPNPFNPSTTVKFQILNAGNVSLKVYNILGQEMISLVNDYMSEGTYSAKFDASKFASGIYICQLKVNDFVSGIKMILTK
jgi:hypothetical protein